MCKPAVIIVLSVNRDGKIDENIGMLNYVKERKNDTTGCVG